VSTETAILVELRAIHAGLNRLSARLDATAPTPQPERLRTSEAVMYVRLAYRQPRFAARSLYKWLATGRLTNISKPRRWLRAELDVCMSGSLNSEGL
jgi:hypothetical protein